MKRQFPLCYFIFLFLFITEANGQKINIYQDKTLGTSERDDKVNIVSAGGYQVIVACITDANINGHKSDPNCDSTTKDIWILKFDTAFFIQWDRSIGGADNEGSSRLLVNNISNEIIFSSLSNSDSSCEKSENNRSYPLNGSDYWICKLDTNGNKIWDKTYGGLMQEIGNQIIELNSGNFILGGSTFSGQGGDKSDSNYSVMTDYWLLKLDYQGNKIWDKVYGGFGYESADDVNYSMCLIPVSASDFLLAGSTDSPYGMDISDTSRGKYDIWIIKIDSSGNKIWDKRFGGSEIEKVSKIISTPDQGFIFCGQTDSPGGMDITDSSKGATDCWIVKLDSLGNKQWDKRYGGNKGDNGIWIDNAPGGGYWVSCQTNSDSSYDVSENPYGAQDFWVLKIDSAGNKLYDKRFGGPGLNYYPRFVILPDSSIMLCGSSAYGTSTVKTDPGIGDRDIWCIHFKYEDTLSTSGIIIQSPSGEFATVHPNPANQFFNVKWSLPSTENILFYLYDATGRIVLTRNSIIEEKEMNISIQEIPSGLYFWKVSCKSRYDQNGKIVILR